MLRCGGARPDDPALADGFYYLPDACSTAATARMSVVQDESFGPVLTVETFTRRGRGASRIANDSIYGLAGGGLDRRTPAGPSGSPAGCGWARSGSTTTTPTCRRPSGAATSSPASAASSGRPGSTSTARPSTSGTTSRPAPQRWFDGRAEDADSSRRREPRALRLRHRRRRLGRLRARQPAQRRPAVRRSWCSRPAAPTSGSTRSSTCRPRCPTRSATGSTTGSTSPSPSRTWTAARSTTPAARCSAAPAASTG